MCIRRRRKKKKYRKKKTTIRHSITISLVANYFYIKFIRTSYVCSKTFEAITATPIFRYNKKKQQQQHWLETVLNFFVIFSFHFHYFQYLDRVIFIKTHRNIIIYADWVRWYTQTRQQQQYHHHHFIVTTYAWIIFAIVYVNCRAEYSKRKKKLKTIYIAAKREKNAAIIWNKMNDRASKRLDQQQQPQQHNEMFSFLIEFNWKRKSSI